MTRDRDSDSQIKTRVTGGRTERAANAAAAAPPADEGSLVEIDPGYYEIVREHARGGMGRILLARDRRLGRTVAIKEMRARADDDASRRFVREALVTARLQHPAIVPVYEAGRWQGGQPFYVMKLVEGRSLDELLRAAEGLPERLSYLPHLTAVAEAVAYAHEKRVVHRDLKPANVVVGAFGETVVVDWGLARELDSEPGDPPGVGVGSGSSGDGSGTVVGTVLGTPSYMAPEQARGLPVDERADVYALGAMLHFLLTGSPPRRGDRGRDILAAAAAGGVDAAGELGPDVPADLAAMVAKAMAPDRDDRYPSAREMAADLRRFQTGQLVSAHTYTLRDLMRRFVARHRTEVTLAAALSTILVVAVVTGFIAVRRQARVAEGERDRAQAAAERAEQIDAFLVDMLGSADPRVLGRDVTVASVLDEASGRVDRELAGQPDVRAAVHTTLGTTYQGLGLIPQARDHLTAALGATRQAYGPENLDVARAMTRLAGTIEEQGEFEEAARLNREALAMLDRIDATRGVDAAQAKGSLARILKWLGDAGAAETMFRETLEIQRGLEGDHRAEIAATLNNLGVLLGERGDWAEAEPLIREALEMIRSVRGPEHPDVAAGLSTLGAALEQTGDLEGAEASYRASLDMREKLLGPDHPDTARSLYALAGLLQVKGDADDAIAMSERILALRGDVLPDTHPMVAAALNIEGLSLLDLTRLQEAEPVLRESLRLRQASLPADHWLVASSKSALGACLAAEGRTAEAEHLLLEAYGDLEAARGADHQRTREAALRLAELYETTSRADEAAAWRRLASPRAP